MTGLRTYTTLDPNQWRFPRWRSGVFYPAGSFVAVTEYNPIDSEQAIWSFWVSLRDVDAITDSERGITYAPNDSDSDWRLTRYGFNPWGLAFDTTQNTLNAQIIADVAALQPLLALIGVDSEIALFKRTDSDYGVRLKDLDSDMLEEIADRRDADSEIDSEIGRVEHNFKAADSDILVVIADNDSEIKRMLDSERHDRMSVDSDLLENLKARDSEIRRLMDSDKHDRVASDSDIMDQLDSDVFVLRRDHDSDSDRLVNFIKRYEDRDSDIQNRFEDHDSDIAVLYGSSGGSGSSTQGSTGFPAGTILAFSSTTMPVGFQIANGATFSASQYPELNTILGGNTLPDLRNQFLRGYNDGTDGFGNARGVLSTQGDELRSHNHGTNALTTRAGINYDSGPFTLGTATINNTGGDETRPTNVMVVYGIAMYTGAGIVFDSEIIESVLHIMNKDRDSDINMLLNRTNYHSDVYAPTVNVASGGQYDVGVTISAFEDIDVMLNGVSVTQWTTSGSIFTLNFALRANTDVVTFKLRR